MSKHYTALTLNVTLGNGISARFSHTIINSAHVTRDSESSTGFYCNAVSHMYLDKPNFAAGSEPVDSFRFKFECDISGSMVAARTHLKTLTSVTGTSLPGVSGKMGKNRGFDFTSALDA